MYVLCTYRDFWESGLRQLEGFKHYYLQPFAINFVDYPNTEVREERKETEK